VRALSEPGFTHLNFQHYRHATSGSRSQSWNQKTPIVERRPGSLDPWSLFLTSFALSGLLPLYGCGGSVRPKVICFENVPTKSISHKKRVNAFSPKQGLCIYEGSQRLIPPGYGGAAPLRSATGQVAFHSQIWSDARTQEPPQRHMVQAFRGGEPCQRFFLNPTPEKTKRLHCE